MKINTIELQEQDAASVILGSGKIYLTEFRVDLPLAEYEDPKAELHKLFEAKAKQAAELLLKNRPEVTEDQLEGFILLRNPWQSIHSGNHLYPFHHFAIGSVVVDLIGNLSVAQH
jgi:hypothetical protein